MIAMTLAEIAAVTDGEVHGDPGLTVSGASYVDTRSPVEDGLYVAIVGERVDGHDFAEGAHAVLGSRPTAAPTVVVADPVVALGRLAAHVRGSLGASVLALTGSQGKTSTKDLLAHVLTDAGVTVATRANLNNEIGVPLTVLRAEPATDFLVVEMGARGVGHIAYLCEIAHPDIAAVLNVGTAHMAEFGSREAIGRAKREIVESLPATGTAVLNADDDVTSAMSTNTQARGLTFGLGGDVTWRGVELDDRGRASCELGYDGRWQSLHLQVTGRHQVGNAAAAAAMAVAAGLAFDDVVASLGRAQAESRWRSELAERPDGLLVINDAYNANPDSMRAAIDTLVTIGGRRSGRTVAILGVMLELGDESSSAHREVGAAAAKAGVDVVIAVGEQAGGIAEGASAVSGWAGESIITAGRDDAVRWVRENALAEDVVLVKASRDAGLRAVADQLLTHDHREGGTGTP